MYKNLIECYESFYHGPIVSKIWLLENLEKIISIKNYKKPNVHILGCWQNVLAFMMQIRKPNFYSSIHGYDLDSLAIAASNRICDAWKYEESKIFNHVKNVYDINFLYDPESIYINCSCDQFVDTTWFKNIPDKSLIVLQATDIVDDSQSWLISQKFTDINDLLNKFKFSEILFADSKKIHYDTLSYNRLMAIGIK